MPPRSVSRSRSRSRSRSASRSRSRSRSARSRSGSPSFEGYRLHVGDIGGDLTQRQIEDVFSKYGQIVEVWLARYPPWFAFIVYRKKRDAEDALAAVDRTYIGDYKVRVTMAHPRKRGPRGPPPRPRYGGGGGSGGGGRDRGGERDGGYGTGRSPHSSRCYECGEWGHFGRDCDLRRRRQDRERGGGGGGRRSPSYSPRRRRSYSRSASPPRRR